MKTKNYVDGERKAELAYSVDSEDSYFSYGYLEMWSSRKHVTVNVEARELSQAEVVSMMERFSI